MLNALPSNTYLGFFDPLQNQVSLHRVNEQILTNNFEQLHVKSLKSVGEGPGASALKNAGELDKHAREKAGELLKIRVRSPRFEVAWLEGDYKTRKEKLTSELKRSVAYADAAYKARVRDKVNEKEVIDVSA